MKERPILFSGPIAETFFLMIIPEPMSGCWLWLGALNGKGYGRFRNAMAHRVAVELDGRPVHAGYEVDHRCRIRCCVNPDHLDVVTHAENIRRKRYSPMCPKGHAVAVIGGSRRCRQCDRDRAARSYVQRGATRRRRPHLTDEERDKIASLIAAGVSHAKIAREVGTSASTVSRVRNA